MRYKDDKHRDVAYYVSKLDYSPEKGLTGLPEIKEASAADKEKRLKERVEQFWKLRTADKFSEMYKLYDPAYRAAVSAPDYEKFQGNVVPQLQD